MSSRRPRNPLIHAAAASFLLAAGVSFEARADEAVAPAPAAATDAPVENSAAPAVVPAAPAPAPATVGAPSSGTVATATATATKEVKAPHPWAGTRLYYGFGSTPYTFYKGSQPHWNPTVFHHLDLWGEWHFNKLLMARVLGGVSQEFTQSDDTSRLYETVLSDFSVDSGVEGYALPWVGLKGSLTGRVVLPFSKTSLAATRLFTLGVGAGLTKKFEIGGGLIVGYAARFSWRFHRATTGEPQQNPNMGCRAQTSEVCDNLMQTGARNAWGDLFQGPRVVWTPNEKIYVVAFYYVSNQFLYRATPVTGELAASTGLQQQGQDSGYRSQNRIGGFVGWDFIKGLGVSLGYDTASPQLGLNGQYQFPLFNQYSQLSLDLTVDIDEALSHVL